MAKNIEPILDELEVPEKEGLHPAFAQCFPVFMLPFGMFLLFPFGVNHVFIYFFFVYLEFCLYHFARLYILTTHYVFWDDRIEFRAGLFRSTSKSIPFSEITEVTCKQSLYQRLFKIGDIFIETAGGREFTIALAGVKYPKQITDTLFALKKRGR